MTINTTSVRSGPYTGTNSTDTYAYDFKVQLSSEIVIMQTDLSSVITTLVEGTHYNVTGVGDNGGGNVVRIAGNLPTGFIWLVSRSTATTQGADFPGQGAFTPLSHENAFDKVHQILQEREGENSRSIRFDNSASAAQLASTVIPSTTLSRFISIGASGLMELVSILDGVVALSRSVIGAFLYPITAAEGNTVVDIGYKYGHGFRYGMVSDSSSGVQGTDNATFLQNAFNSGFFVTVPNGWFSSESTVFGISAGSAGGGKGFKMQSGTRLERYTNVPTPILHFAGDQDNIDLGGGTLAARNFGGFTRGLLLFGQDPNATDNTGATEIDTMVGILKSVKVIGKTSNTGWDGSVGIYFESASRRRGQFLGIQSYFGRISDLYVTQFDYPFFLSTDFNAHSFRGCVSTQWGHAGFWVNGFNCNFIGCHPEIPTAQDATERAGWQWGNKDSGPEAVNKLCEDDATELTIIAITKGSPTTIQTSAAHGESTGNLIKLDSIVDSGANDLEAALNTNHYKLTSTGADTFTIPVDTSAVSATWASGGVVNTDPYPILGAKANRVYGNAELTFDASTKKTRLMLQDRPGGNFDTEPDFRGSFGKNVMDVSGVFPGGVAKDGFSTITSILNNVINYQHALIDYYRLINFHGWKWTRLADDSGSSFGTDEFKTYSGRVADMVESFTYDLISIDNVGATSASILIELTIQSKDAAGQDHLGGPITFMCPVTASTARPALEVVRHFSHFGNNDEPALVPIVVESAGTAANTGKFTVKLATQVVTGTGDFFCDWTIKIISSNLEGVNLDWNNDVKLLTSSTSGLVKDTKWARKTKFKIADQTKNSDTTLADDTHLHTWDLDDDTEYVVIGSIDVSTSVTPDFKVHFDFSQATQDIDFSFDHLGLHAVQAVDANTVSLLGGGQIVLIQGTFKSNATAGGDVSFQWAQNTSDAGATIVKKGSWIKIIRADAIRSELI